MEYDQALNVFARVKKVDVREGRAQRGRTAQGTWVVRPPHGSVLELTPAKAHLDLDKELALVEKELQLLLDTERASLLRYVTGSVQEFPRADAAYLRRLVEQRNALREMRSKRNDAYAQSLSHAVESNAKAQELAQQLAETDLSDGAKIGALLQERKHMEQRREAAWYETYVESVVWSEPQKVQEHAEMPALHFRVI